MILKMGRGRLAEEKVGGGIEGFNHKLCGNFANDGLNTVYAGFELERFLSKMQ
jgi:hypothetical protein